ncbi:GntR family transcriptional regulator [Yinghuangia soli]|uniref:GntR family transcriptional regulator n=1 Tax=Yinghuangia soli TaxID=2908204 RepID=A0AA41U3F5_9ACTN|nr:GntR family transcriptional regulator [Yinghuangia soli]MCF2531780.1 GntR family transcriptional regulator [Yinghuangia soli]
MDITLDPHSPAPPFEQVRQAIAEQARTGVLAVGTKLPTVRALAAELGLAVNTVARAYRELEADAVLETRGRHGTFVAAVGDTAHREGAAAAGDYAKRARRLGLTKDEALAAVATALDAAYTDH